ncbi:MAG: spermidine/putrescine ABC transporter permease PotC [Gammaproteobacteria bacterium]|nr:spermidine/putrescine ABC transporter permease PotC [Gammaproteobacteria bacterium]
MKLSNSTKSIYTTLIYLFIYIPIFIVIIFSFNNASRSLLWHGFTFHWYKILWHDSAIFTVVMHSLTIGIIAASIATIIGTLTAVNLFRYKFCGKQLLHGLLFILIVTPDIVMGISLLILYNVLKVPLGFWSLLLAHITFCIPFVAVTVYSRVITLDKSIFEAARDLGANDLTIFGKIVIPLLLPAILAGWLLSFTLSLDDVIISYFVSGPGYEILPLKIYSMVRMGIKPEINALCTIMLILTFGIVIISQLAFRKKQ